MRLDFEEDSGLMIPGRDLRNTDLVDIQTQVDVVTAAVVQPLPTAVPTTAGAAKALTSCSATESPAKVQGRTVSQVSVSFTRDPSDDSFAGARVWFKGYKGNAEATLMAEAADSPVTFLCETTGETVTVLAQAVSATGVPADLDASPTTTVALDGVVSAPPAPSISQSLLGVPLGYQFAFNQLAAQPADVIDSYRVYRNTSASTFAGSSLLRPFKHDPTSLGAIVVQDNVGGGRTYYYFVTAVNTIGLESSATAAQSGAVASGVAGSSDITVNVPANSTNNATVDSIDAGSNTTIRVYGPSGVGNSWTLYVGSSTFTMPYITITGAGYATTYYIYCHADGSSPAASTTAFPTLPDNIVFCGKVTTVAAGGGGGTGGGGGSGGGGGCPLSGAPVVLYGNPEWWNMRVIPCEDFISIETESGRQGTFSRNDRRYQRRGLLTLTEWRVGDYALTEDGEERVTAVIAHYIPGATVDSYEATHGHVYSAWGFVGHNMKLAVQ